MPEIRLPSAEQFKATLVKEYREVTNAINNPSNAYGMEYIASGGSHLWKPLDVSNYEKKIIKITNNHDVAIQALSFYSFVVHSAASSNNIFEQFVKETTLAAGATKIWKGSDLPQLDEPMVGLVLYHYQVTKATTGSLTIQIIGG